MDFVNWIQISLVVQSVQFIPKIFGMLLGSRLFSLLHEWASYKLTSLPTFYRHGIHDKEFFPINLHSDIVIIKPSILVEEQIIVLNDPESYVDYFVDHTLVLIPRFFNTRNTRRCMSEYISSIFPRNFYHLRLEAAPRVISAVT